MLRKLFIVLASVLGILITMNVAYAANYGSIRVLSATYGDFSPNGKRCDATEVVRARCHGKLTCAVMANDSLCGTPDPTRPRWLQINYQCKNGRGAFAAAKEFDVAEIDCTKIGG